MWGVVTSRDTKETLLDAQVTVLGTACPSGSVLPIAGTGTAGVAGDGRAPLQAELIGLLATRDPTPWPRKPAPDVPGMAAAAFTSIAPMPACACGERRNTAVSLSAGSASEL